MTVQDLKSSPSAAFKQTLKKEIYSLLCPFDAVFINDWCTFSPTSPFWEIINKSSSVIQLPRMFPSVGVKDASLRVMLTLSVPVPPGAPSILFPHGTVRQLTALPPLCHSWDPFPCPTKQSIWRYSSERHGQMECFFFFCTPSTIQQLFNCERYRALIVVSIANGFIKGGTFLWLNGG